MPSNVRVCLRCGNSIADKAKQARFCSEACQKAEERDRKMVDNFEDKHGGPKPNLSRAVAEAAREAVKAPVVRQALQEEVMRATSRIIGMSDMALNVLEDHLQSEDPKVSGPALALWMKQNQALLPKDDIDNSQIVVNFALPRPESPQETTEEVEATELKVCDICGDEKPADEFVAGSDRCQTCFDERKQAVLEKFLG